MKKVSFNINGTTIEYDVDGDTAYGSDGYFSTTTISFLALIGPSGVIQSSPS